MPTEREPARWLESVRRSHDRLTSVAEPLGSSDLRGPSYCTEWSIAQVLSHLGSQAEIFSLLVDAGLSGGVAPSQEAFPPIWEAWNGRSPEDQSADSVAANEQLVRRLEGLGGEELAKLRLQAFGTDLDAAGLLRMRLSEHAVHTWDVEVALDPGARVAPDAVHLLVDGLPEVAARAGRPASSPASVVVTTTDPARQFTLDTGGVTLEPGAGAGIGPTVELAAETLLRLVYGRVDTAHRPTSHVGTTGTRLDQLAEVFPGF